MKYANRPLLLRAQGQTLIKTFEENRLYKHPQARVKFGSNSWVERVFVTDCVYVCLAKTPEGVFPADPRSRRRRCLRLKAVGEGEPVTIY